MRRSSVETDATSQPRPRCSTSTAYRIPADYNEFENYGELSAPEADYSGRPGLQQSGRGWPFDPLVAGMLDRQRTSSAAATITTASAPRSRTWCSFRGSAASADRIARSTKQFVDLVLDLDTRGYSVPFCHPAKYRLGSEGPDGPLSTTPLCCACGTRARCHRGTSAGGRGRS